MQIIIYQLILLEEDLIGLFKKPYFKVQPRSERWDLNRTQLIHDQIRPSTWIN